MSDATIQILANIGLFGFLALSAWILLLTGSISFGQQGLFAVGAYAGGIATAVWQWPFPIALASGSALGALCGALVALSTLRLSGVHYAIATLAFAELVRSSLNLITFQREVDGYLVGPAGADGFRNVRWIFEAGWNSLTYLLLIWSLLASVLLIIWMMGRARGMLRIRGVGEDPLLATSLGQPVERIRISAAAFAGAVASLGGVLYVHMATYVEPAMFGVMTGVHALAYGLIGGLGTALGPILGVVIDIGLLEALRVFSAYRMIIFGGLVVAVLIWRPRGLLDEATVRRLASWRRY